jgi:hypothetical protein
LPLTHSDGGSESEERGNRICRAGALQQDVVRVLLSLSPLHILRSPPNPSGATQVPASVPLCIHFKDCSRSTAISCLSQYFVPVFVCRCPTKSWMSIKLLSFETKQSSSALDLKLLQPQIHLFPVHTSYCISMAKGCSSICFDFPLRRPVVVQRFIIHPFSSFMSKFDCSKGIDVTCSSQY